MQKVLLGAFSFLIALSMSSQLLAQAPANYAAQHMPRGTTTDITAAEIQATAAKQPASMPLSDQMLRVVSINNGEYSIGEAIVHRAKPNGATPPTAMEHSHVAEAYVIISGSATLVSGGTMDNVKDIGSDGRTGPTSTGHVQGGVSFEMGPGDVAIIPPNTPHYFSAIKSDELTYIVDRIDPYNELAMPGDKVGKSTAPISAPGPVVGIKAAEMLAAGEQTGPGVVQVLRVVDINNGQYNISVALLHRTPTGDNILEHSDITEIYHIISGNATIETGGTIENPKVAPANPRVGPGFSGPSILNGVSAEVGPGDVLIIPPNTPHYYSKVKSDKIVYLVIRIDPHHMLSMPPEDAAAAAKAAAR